MSRRSHKIHLLDKCKKREDNAQLLGPAEFLAKLRESPLARVPDDLSNGDSAEAASGLSAFETQVLKSKTLVFDWTR